MLGAMAAINEQDGLGDDAMIEDDAAPDDDEAPDDDDDDAAPNEESWVCFQQYAHRCLVMGTCQSMDDAQKN